MTNEASGSIIETEKQTDQRSIGKYRGVPARKGGKAILFGKKKQSARPQLSRFENGLPTAVAFVDYESWYVSLIKNYGIKPDIVSMAKAMGGGLPIGAICAKEEVAKSFTSGSHGSTYSGNPVACAASLAQIGELLDRDLAGNAKKMGAYFMDKLRELVPHVKEVRGLGLMVGVEFEDGFNAVDVKHACFDRKLIITAIGSSVIRMVPPLILTEKECDKAAEIIADAVKSLEK